MSKAKFFFANRMNIKQKIWAIIAVVIAILVLGVSVGAEGLMQAYNEQLYIKTAEVMAYSSEKIVSRLDNISDLSKYIMTDKALQESIEKLETAETIREKSQLKEVIIRKLNDYYVFNNEIISISILTENQSVTLGLDASEENTEKQEEIFSLAREADGEAVWIFSGRDDNSFLCARKIRKIDNIDLGELGFVVIRVDMRNVVKNAGITNLMGEYSHKVFLLYDDSLIYSNVKASDRYFQNLSLKSDKFEIATINREKFLVVSRWIDQIGMKYFELVPYNQIFDSIWQTAKIIIYSIFIAVVIALTISTATVRQITNRITTLNHMMKRYQTGEDIEMIILANTSADDEKQKDEIKLLQRRFGNMVVEHNKLTQDNIAKMILLKEHRIRELEQQINPHFFYNALESISWYAKLANQSEISRITDSLGSLLRTTLTEKDDVISVGREVLMVESYIEIQSIQYPERLRFKKCISHNAMKYTVPKMSIQPLVENAIVHGLEEMPDVCEINLNISIDNDYLYVNVQNNDTFIDENLLLKDDNKAVNKGFGIGLRNIDSRIKLIYGERYGLSLRNIDGNVDVSFFIPKVPEKED